MTNGTNTRRQLNGVRRNVACRTLADAATHKELSILLSQCGIEEQGGHPNEILKTVLGEKHPDYAWNLNNHAEIYHLMGDYARTEPRFRQARDIRKAVYGEKNKDYAESLNRRRLKAKGFEWSESVS